MFGAERGNGWQVGVSQWNMGDNERENWKLASAVDNHEQQRLCVEMRPVVQSNVTSLTTNTLVQFHCTSYLETHTLTAKHYLHCMEMYVRDWRWTSGSVVSDRSVYNCCYIHTHLRIRLTLSITILWQSTTTCKISLLIKIQGERKREVNDPPYYQDNS